MISRLEIQNRETAYQNYVTDALQAIANNTAGLAGGKDLKIMTMSMRFNDLLNGKSKKKEETPKQNGHEIADSIISRLTGRK